jgi:hypothetical protein
MRWYKTASDHGDTLHGQHLAVERGRLSREVDDLRGLAATGNVGVLQRWAGEVRRRMLLLPPAERVARMSPYELGKLSVVVSGIRGDMTKYEAPKHG